MNRKIKNNNHAVSEVLGTILLIMISVTLFSTIYLAIFSTPVNPTPPTVDLVGTIVDNQFSLHHQGGEQISLNSIVILGTDTDRERFLVKDILDSESKENGYWNIGEFFKFNLQNLSTNVSFNRFDPLDVSVVDKRSNSVIMMGKVQENRYADIELNITASKTDPDVGDSIDVFFKAINNGPSVAKNISIQINIPGILKLVESSVNDDDDGYYWKSTGIWDINSINSTDNAELKLEFVVVGMPLLPTQLAIIIDGSTNTNDFQWQEITKGLAKAIENKCIPNNNMVELTVIQCGGENFGTGHLAQIEVNKVVLSNNPADTQRYYLNVANQVQSMSKLNGYYSLGCGIRVAADTLKDSNNYPMNTTKASQLINLIVGDEPNRPCLHPTPTAETPDIPTPRKSAELQRRYLLTQLVMRCAPDFGYDKIDCELYQKDSASHYTGLHRWLETNIIYPNVFPDTHSYEVYGKGWLQIIQSGDDFPAIIQQYFINTFKGQTISMSIISTEYSDNDPSNDIAELTLIPVVP